jgi:non-ribosomal peptide synthetase component E (peptide arylation enzyme)
MSELGGGAMTRHTDDAEEPLTTVGLPFPHGEAKVVDAAGAPVPPGTVGHLLYRRADMFRGYLGDPEATREALDAGWLRTGDLAAIDGKGRVVYHGRSKDIINRGGVKVSAHELERCLGEMPRLRQLAVVAVPDPRLGERACLVLATSDGGALALDDVRGFLSARGVAKYKWPESVVVLERLPQTPSGKIAKRAVRELVHALDATAGAGGEAE